MLVPHEQPRGGLLSTARPTDRPEPILHTGKETTAPHDRTKTQHQRTIDWTKNILIFSIQFKTYKDHSVTTAGFVHIL